MTTWIVGLAALGCAYLAGVRGMQRDKAYQQAADERAKRIEAGEIYRETVTQLQRKLARAECDLRDCQIQRDQLLQQRGATLTPTSPRFFLGQISQGVH